MYAKADNDSYVIRLADWAFIPKDERNRDWLEAEKWLRSGNSLVELEETPATVPERVTRGQGKAALIEADLWDAVAAAVSAIPSKKQRQLAEVALYDSLYWERQSPFLSSMAKLLGLSDEQLDALFVAASKINL